MLQTYKKAEEYITRSKTGSFMLLPYTEVKQEADGVISFGQLRIDKNDVISLVSDSYNDITELAYVGINAIPFTQKLKQTIIGVRPFNCEPKYMTIHAGKVYPILPTSKFKYGVLQNPEPLMTVTQESYKRLSAAVTKEIQEASSIAMLISDDEVRKDPNGRLAYEIAQDVRLHGRSVTATKKEARKLLMDSRVRKLPFTETINYEV